MSKAVAESNYAKSRKATKKGTLGYALDQRDFATMEKGHRVCKLVVLKKFDIVYRRIWLNSQTHQIALSKWRGAADQQNGGPSTSAGVCSNCPSGPVGIASKTYTIDLRLVKEAQVLAQVGNTLQIVDKWRRDAALQRFDPNMVLCISWGTGFVLNHWLILFDHQEACQLWCQGVRQLCQEQQQVPHALLIERWLRKQFYSLLPHPTATACVTIKHMKPFVQQRLQYKVTSKQLQEIIDGEMGFEGFVLAHSRLLDFHSLFLSMFAEYTNPLLCGGRIVAFERFLDFLRDVQHDEMGQSKEQASSFLRHYLRDVDPDRDVVEPWLSTEEFIDYLYSRENSLFDPINNGVVHDMTKPLTHYWISSSHNTYLTGDQLRSESSLDAYSRALLMGCRCIELDCWDGPQKKGPNGELLGGIDIVIYHGYTMTSKLALRDVLHTIRRYAFQTSEFPVILSIEDNCSVPAQRQMAVDIQEVLGDLLLTAPVSRDEWQLPSPEALRRKIILKHKKLQLATSESDASSLLLEDELEQDILSRRCVKKGVLWMKSNVSSTSKAAEWSKHIFVLFADRLCYLVQSLEDKGDSRINDELHQKSLAAHENSLGSQGDDLVDESAANSSTINNIDACANAHFSEEWFHGKIDRDIAKKRLLEAANTIGSNANSNGLFLVRESSTFIGDFTLSFMHNSTVHHCRIKASVSAGGERKYHLLDTVRKDTLYELISFYTQHSLDTPNFKTYLQTPCPQPQPHLGQPWFAPHADTQRAEQLLSCVSEDGAFLLRYSTSDRNVFVLSLRVDSKLWHYRLKREGRTFMVNQHQFEDLCQLVDYYSQNQFVRGICLKYPINEETVAHYATKTNALRLNDEMNAFESSLGYYMELKDLDKEVQAEAIEAFDGDEKLLAMLPQGESRRCLNFPIGARITVLQKNEAPTVEENTQIWMGRYNNEIGWFPARCVREVSNAMETQSVNGVNELNYGTIELVGTTFEQSDSSERPHSFRSWLAQSHWNVQEYWLAADSADEMEEWLNACQNQAHQANEKVHELRNKEKQLRIASELSSLVVYCQAVPFNPDFELQDPRSSFYEMCSFSESKHEKLLERGLTRFNQRQLSRVYPQASRLTSANFNPMPMWNSGCHMVALNFQTGDKAMQLNHGRFLANGRCGFVLKPQYLLDETFQQKNHQQQMEAKRNMKCLFCRGRRSVQNLLTPSTSTLQLSQMAPGENKKALSTSNSRKSLTGRPPKLSLTTNSSEGGDWLEDASANCCTSLSAEEQQKDFCCCASAEDAEFYAAESESCFDQLSNCTIQKENPATLLPNRACPIHLSIAVIAGRHLSRKGGSYDKSGICSPYVEVELLGFAHDSQQQRTNTITSNGLNPVWQERFEFRVRHPEMCLLRFYVEDGDFMGPKTDPFIGQAIMPLDCIRPGFRSVPLLNQFGEPLELSALLVHIQILHWNLDGNVEPPNCLMPASNLLLDSASAFTGLQPSALNKTSVHNTSGIQSAVFNVHQWLQSGRSIYDQTNANNGNESDQSRHLNRSTSTSFESRQMQMLSVGPPNLLSAQNVSSERTSRSTSMESADTNSTNNSSAFMLPANTSRRGMGTNTLRRIFRMGKNNNN